MKLAVKYDNGMYTTKVPDLIKEDELDVDECDDGYCDDVDTSFIEAEDKEIAYLIKHFAKSGKL